MFVLSICFGYFFFFFFNDTATTEIYTLSLHDALPISKGVGSYRQQDGGHGSRNQHPLRSEEHTSELQSHHDLVCRLLLKKKKKNKKDKIIKTKGDTKKNQREKERK